MHSPKASSWAKSWIGKLSKEQEESLRRDYPLGLGKPEMVADVILFLLSASAGWTDLVRWCPQSEGLN